MAYPTLEGSATIATVVCTTLFFFIVAVGAAFKKEGGGWYTPVEFLKLVRTPNVHWLSAKNSLPWQQVGMSYFAGGMGAWVYYGSTEMGANTRLSWWGVLGYSLASAIPAIVMIYIAPAIKDFVGDKNGFSVTDFALTRFGRTTQLVTAFMSTMYLFIYLCAEITTIGNVAVLFCGESDEYTRKAVLATLCVITLTYTMLCGLPASVVTDRLQGIMISGFMIFFTILVLAKNRVSASAMKAASKSTTSGFTVMVTLIIAILAAELFNAGQWQRVYAAKSTQDLRKGLAFGAALIFVVMWFFGVLGVIAAAKYADDFANYEKFHYLAYFYLAENLAKGWHVLILIFATALCVSSVDSIQNGLTSVLYRDILNYGIPVNSVRVICAALNVGAIFVAIDKIDVLSLFLMVDLVCALAAPALYLGLIRKDINKYMVAPTELGALMGVVSASIAVIVQGAVLDLDGAWTDVYGSVHSTKAAADVYPPSVHRAWGPFGNFWLPDGTTIEGGGLQAFGGERTLLTFILATVFSTFGTMFFSWLDIYFRGERARKPLIEFKADKTSTETEGKV
jgi:SSS family solute:Na+ symporter